VQAAVPAGVTVWPLHGGLDADAQDAALRPTGGPRVILATNVAETTLTVPDVTAVVDTGVHKVARYDAERAIDRLVTERIPQDSADQRAGRAGRVAAGRVWRLWDARDRLRPHREAEILRIDLASTVLDVCAWGGDPFTPGSFDWFERPPAHALDAARALLIALGALDGRGRITPLGAALRRVPAHPRLARLLFADGVSDRAARAVAWLSEGRRPGAATPGGGAATAECDVLAAVDPSPGDASRAFPRHLEELARSLVRTVRTLEIPAEARAAGSGDERFQRALLAAYPDRVARRRERHGDRFVLATGTGARLNRASIVHHAEFIVAVDVHKVDGASGPRRPRQDGPATAGLADEPTIVMASRIDPEWLTPTSRDVVHTWDAAAGKPRAARVARYDQLVLSSHPVAVDPVAAVPIVWRAWVARERTDDERLVIHRLRFAGDEAPFADIVRQLEAGGVDHADADAPPVPDWWTSLDQGDTPLEALPADARRRLSTAAPSTLVVPSGREHRLDYRSDGSVVASVKLQELFGLARTPDVGPRRVPVTFELLAPNGRPVQVTRDLASFWARGYPDVRKELRGRYPRHPWPDDPWSATPTARAKPRERR
jgi:ATP-dependent helicase HrpB